VRCERSSEKGEYLLARTHCSVVLVLAAALSLVCLEVPSAAAVSSLPIYLVVPPPFPSAPLRPL
jgi:hypothetical protein